VGREISEKDLQKGKGEGGEEDSSIPFLSPFELR